MGAVERNRAGRLSVAVSGLRQERSDACQRASAVEGCVQAGVQAVVEAIGFAELCLCCGGYVAGRVGAWLL